MSTYDEERGALYLLLSGPPSSRCPICICMCHAFRHLKMVPSLFLSVPCLAKFQPLCQGLLLVLSRQGDQDTTKVGKRISRALSKVSATGFTHPPSSVGVACSGSGKRQGCSRYRKSVSAISTPIQYQGSLTHIKYL